jgi:hypothetical protein
MSWGNQSVKKLLNINIEKDPIEIVREKARQLVINVLTPYKLVTILGNVYNDYGL